jgi:cobalt-zinc-cadmium efflux system outer membrane protein
MKRTLIVLAGAVCSVLLAQPPPPLVLDDLVREALERNPEVLAAQKNYEAARQRPSQESSLPETMLSVGYNSSGRPWPGAGIGVEPIANAGFMVTQEFPFFGKRKLRGDIARKEAQAEFDQYQSIQLSVVSRVKQAYYRLAHTYLMRELLLRNRDLLEKVRKISEIRYSVGRAAQQDIFKLQTQLSVIEAKLIQYDREQGSRENEILSLLARPALDKLGKTTSHTPQALRYSLEELLAAANGNAPMLQRDRHMIQRTQLALNLARKDYYPDYAVSGGYYNMGRMPDMYQFRLDIKLPTSAFRKQKAAETEQAMRLASSRRTLEATAQSLAFRIKDDFLMAQTSLRLMRAYEYAVVPQATLALESSLASYETGAVDLLSVLSNFLTVIEHEMNYHEESLNAHLAAARLEEVTGLRLIEGSQP